MFNCIIFFIIATAEVNCTLDDRTNDAAYPCDNTCCVNITLNITPVRQCIRIDYYNQLLADSIRLEACTMAVLRYIIQFH